MGTPDSAFDRLCDALLGHGSSSMQGDERDRFHWYEAIVVGATVQWIAIPWALFVLAAVDAERFGPALWTVFVVWLIPLLLTSAYANRRKVQQPDDLDRTGWITVLATFVPLVGFLAIMAWPSGDSWGAIARGALTTLAVVALLWLGAWSAARRGGRQR